MRIGIFDPYLDDLGGGEKYMMTMASCLSKKHEVVVFWDDASDIDQIKKRFSLDLSNITLCKNIFSANVGSLKKIQESKQYDALIVLSDGSIPLLFSKKLFLHIQQPLTHIKSLSWKEKVKLHRVNGIFYNSQFTKSFNDKVFSNVRSSVIYPPVSLHQKNIEKKNIIVHVGRFRVKNVGIDDYKKQGVMVQAFKDMVDSEMIKDWKFIIAASVRDEDREKFAELEKSAQGYPIDFLVNKTNEEVWDLYNTSKIYWHASGFGEDLIQNPAFAEHFGISTVEAMGAGAVPVVINSGGQKEIVTDGKNGLLWNTLDELKLHTMKLVKNHTLLNELSEKAKERANDFSQEMFCESVESLITT